MVVSKKITNGVSIRIILTVATFILVLAGFVWSMSGWHTSSMALSREVTVQAEEIDELTEALHSIDNRLAVLEEGVGWIKDRMRGNTD